MNTNQEQTEVHPRHLCQNCGLKFEDHAQDSSVKNPWAPAGRCPATAKFPKWPSLRNELKAGSLFDKRIAKHWQTRTTVFKPV